ncbi:hypothetical protein EMCRGX_G031701 [Ephydatia muelleri]
MYQEPSRSTLRLTSLDDVRSLALPGSYHEKITHLGRALIGVSNMKHLDLSRNALESLEVYMTILTSLLTPTHDGFQTVDTMGSDEGPYLPAVPGVLDEQMNTQMVIVLNCHST